MGARWLQAKRNKIRLRRAHLRKLSSHQVKVKGNLSRDAENPHTLGERGKAARTFDQPLPPTKPLTIAQSQGVNAVPRAVVLSKLWQAERMQGVDDWNHITLLDGKQVKVKLFFSGERFFLVEEDFVLRSFKRSLIYNSRQKALRAYSYKRVTWVEYVSMSPAELLRSVEASEAGKPST